jgi:NlpC/P60 family putative phage cell wall peptidase
MNAAVETFTLREQICAEALSWIGTKYHHHACVKGVGVDCVMLLVGVARAAGLVADNWRPPYYSPEWHCHQREELLVQTLRALGCAELASLDEAQPADILAFRFSTPRTYLAIAHVGILLAGQTLVHAKYEKCVQRHRLTGRWADGLAAAFTFPGVAHG